MKRRYIAVFCLWLGLFDLTPGNAREPVPASPTEPLPLTSAERAYLRSLPTLNVAVDKSFRPFTVVDASGHVQGLAIDYLHEIADRLGLRLNFVPAQDWNETMGLIRERRVDLLGTMVPGGIADRYMKSSQPYVSFPLMIVLRERHPSTAGLDDLLGRTILANPQRSADASALTRLLDYRLLPVSSVEVAMKRLAAGEGDAMLGNLASVDDLLSRHYFGVLRVVAPTGVDEPLAVGVRPGLEPLRPLLDRAITAITPREHAAIRNAWFSSRYSFGTSLGTLLLQLLPLLLAGAVAMLALTYAYLKLRREMRLRQLSERMLADVAANLPAVVYKLKMWPDGTRRFIFVGGDPAPLMGLNTEEILADKSVVLNTVHAEDRAMLLDALHESAREMTPLRVELRANVAGRIRFIHSQARPRKGEDGCIYWSGFWSDVTLEHEQAQALAHARDAAEQATQAKSQFLASMSHEIRTPMNGVIGMLDVLAQTTLTSQQRQMVSVMSDSAESLLRIVNDILDFSRVESGELVVAETPMDVRRLVDAVAAIMASSSQAKGLSLQIRVSDDVPSSVVGDDGRLRQILLNLLSNAVKFTQAGTVSLDVDVLRHEPSAQWLSYCVKDTGIGIATCVQEQIFEPFVQGDPSTTRYFGGSGLGLTICRHLAQLMGGHISLESKLAHGTSVRVILPMKLPPTDATSTVCPPCIATSASGVPALPFDAPVPAPTGRVLVVDDHPANRQLLCMQLAMLGMDCREASSGPQALDILAERSFDIVFTDCHMPGMDGFELVRHIRALPEAVAMRVIAVTADAYPDTVTRCKQSGMDHFLAKPVRLPDLEHMLGRNAQDAGEPKADVVVDSGRLRRLMGTDKAMLSLLDTCIAETERKMAELPTLLAAADPQAMAEWLHHVLGGLILIFERESLADAYEVENALHDALDIGIDINHAMVSRLDQHVRAMRQAASVLRR
ncbi:response regulator [Dyella sp.]|uniref:response regulator n=1 Tax=Dyella sp. TaxID=1869338 RepID=UPI002ED4A927